MTQNIQLATTLSFAAARPEFDQQMLDRVVKEVEKTGPILRNSLAPQVLLSLLYTYEDVSEPDFDSYLGFLRSDVGQRYNRAAMNAVDDALTRAARSLGARLIEALKQKRA